jgi:hypothetical protein
MDESAIDASCGICFRIDVGAALQVRVQKVEGEETMEEKGQETVQAGMRAIVPKWNRKSECFISDNYEKWMWEKWTEFHGEGRTSIFEGTIRKSFEELLDEHGYKYYLHTTQFENVLDEGQVTTEYIYEKRK